MREIVNASDDTLGGETRSSFFILGGPGTGKTSILLNVLKDFTDLGKACGVVISEDLARYISATIPDSDLSSFRVDLFDAEATDGLDILLVDDPSELRDFRLSSSDDHEDPKMVVYAFDPLQVSASWVLPDDEFRDWLLSLSSRVYGLDECYRQKEHIGVAVKHALDTIATSTPYLDKRKIAAHQQNHLGLEQVSNGITFPNPHGYLKVHENGTFDRLKEEIKRIRSNPM